MFYIPVQNILIEWQQFLPNRIQQSNLTYGQTEDDVSYKENSNLHMFGESPRRIRANWEQYHELRLILFLQFLFDISTLVTS